jgi:hypothetical protein
MSCAADDEPCEGVQPERTAAPAPAATPLATNSRLLMDLSRFLVMSVPPGCAVGNELEPTYRSRRSSQRRGDVPASYHRDDTFAAAAIGPTTDYAAGARRGRKFAPIADIFSALSSRVTFVAERIQISRLRAACEMKIVLFASHSGEVRTSWWHLVQKDDGTLHVEQVAEYRDGDHKRRVVPINEFMQEGGPPPRALQKLIDRMFEDHPLVMTADKCTTDRVQAYFTIARNTIWVPIVDQWLPPGEYLGYSEYASKPTDSGEKRQRVKARIVINEKIAEALGYPLETIGYEANVMASLMTGSASAREPNSN